MAREIELTNNQQPGDVILYAMGSLASFAEILFTNGADDLRDGVTGSLILPDAPDDRNATAELGRIPVSETASDIQRLYGVGEASVGSDASAIDPDSDHITVH